MNSIKPILYSFRRCPYAMRARMALSYAQLEYELRDILLKNKPQSLLNYSTKGTVPILVFANQVIDESLDIMLWAIRKRDKSGWLDAKNQFDLIQLCDHKFKLQLDQYKYSDRFEKSDEFYREQALWFLVLLNEKLMSQNNLFSDNISLADIAVFPFVRQFAYVNKLWFDSLPFNALKKWLERHMNSALFKHIMLKTDLWKDDCSID